MTSRKDNLVYYGTGQGYMCAAEWRRGVARFRWKMQSLEWNDNTGFSTDTNPELPGGGANRSWRLGQPLTWRREQESCCSNRRSPWSS